MKTLTLKAAREANGWTQLQLGVASGVNPATICRLETGNNAPLHGTVLALEQALGCKLTFHRLTQVA